MALPQQRGPVAAFFLSKFLYDGLLAAAGMGAAIAGVANYRAVSVILAFAVFVCSIGKVIAEMADHREKTDTGPLYGALHVIYHMLIGDDVANGKVNVRLCLHEPDGSNALKQYTEYVGEHSKGKVRRKFPSQCGIIGRALREHTPLIASRKDNDPSKFVDELVSDWSYTVEDAKKITSDRKSWAALPIPMERGKKVQAILYCDANAAEFFNAEREKLLGFACMGIASFIDKTYNS